MGLFSQDRSFQPILDNIAKNRGIYESIDLPDYEEFNPELYNYESANYDLVGEDPALRAKQLDALARFQDLSEGGLSEMDEAGFLKARQLGDQVARSKTDAAINDAQVRGVAGSGQEFAMREQASQAAAQRAQEAAMAEQTARAQQRQMALNAYANQMSGARDQDYRANAQNTDIINRFNQANTQGRNATSHANVDQHNNAFQYNEGLKDKRYQNQTGKADRVAGINNQEAEARSGQAAAEQKRRQAMLGLVGAGAGAFAGGPAGAQVGYQVGSNF
jgi:hypothetical protein